MPRERQPWPRAGIRRRYVTGTGVLTAMFALRLLVEVPLYLAGEAAVGALGAARIRRQIGRASCRERV